VYGVIYPRGYATTELSDPIRPLLWLLPNSCSLLPHPYDLPVPEYRRPSQCILETFLCRSRQTFFFVGPVISKLSMRLCSRYSISSVTCQCTGVGSDIDIRRSSYVEGATLGSRQIETKRVVLPCLPCLDLQIRFSHLTLQLVI
jgi:hypothetical protein